jgi:hypothetical protein
MSSNPSTAKKKEKRKKWGSTLKANRSPCEKSSQWPNLGQSITIHPAWAQ